MNFCVMCRRDCERPVFGRWCLGCWRKYHVTTLVEALAHFLHPPLMPPVRRFRDSEYRRMHREMTLAGQARRAAAV